MISNLSYVTFNLLNKNRFGGGGSGRKICQGTHIRISRKFHNIHSECHENQRLRQNPIELR